METSAVYSGLLSGHILLIISIHCLLYNTLLHNFDPGSVITHIPYFNVSGSLLSVHQFIITHG
jgi:hypothetical protein